MRVLGERAVVYGSPVSFSREAARALETGRWDGPLSRALASALAPVATRGLVRPAIVPSEIGLVCVGGATLGGSGKTRVAIACARELASRGLNIALVGHAYRAAPKSARVVSTEDALEDVGDEALVCARELGVQVPVVIGPTRQAAIDHAVQLSPRLDAIVLDGPIAIRARSTQRSSSSASEAERSSSSASRMNRTVSLLAVDANRPWGSGRLPPAGDLRAPREVLLGHADHVVPVDAMPAAVRWAHRSQSSSKAGSEREDDTETVPLASLRSLSFGLFTAIARPDRLVRALATVGIRPREVVSVSDHGSLAPAAARLARAPVDAWVGTAKCALHLRGVSLGVPVGILEASDLVLPPSALASVRDLCSSSQE